MYNSDLSKKKANFLLTLLLNVSIQLKMHCMVFPKIQEKRKKKNTIGNKAGF